MTVPSLSPSIRSATSRSSSATTEPPGCGRSSRIHSTALGPALGGTRFYPYATEEAALADVLNLSRGMAYKNALAGLDHGGGKAVIIGDPRTRQDARRCCAPTAGSSSRLGGRYFTACDVGTYVADMDVVARESRFVTGRSLAARRRRRLLDPHRLRRLPGHARRGGARLGLADPARPHGSASRASARSATTWSEHLLEDGADVVVTDVRTQAVERVRGATRRSTWRRTPRRSSRADLDVYAPCALGGALDDDDVVERCSAPDRLRRGQQPARPPGRREAAPATSAGILYAPDYVVNSGGVIQVADELQRLRLRAGQSQGGRRSSTPRCRSSRLAADEGVPPAVAADRLAEQRMSRKSGGLARGDRGWPLTAARPATAAVPGSWARGTRYRE